MKSNLLYKAYKYLHALSSNFPPHFLLTHRWCLIHFGITHSYWIHVDFPTSILFVCCSDWNSFSSPNLPSLPCLSDVHSDQASLSLWRLPSPIPSSLTEPETPSCWVLKCSKFNPVTAFVTGICYRIAYQFVYAFWGQELVAYSSLHPHHLVHSTWHTAGTQNYWISELDWLIKNVAMSHSGRMSLAEFLGLAGYFAQVCHRRHVKQTLWTCYFFDHVISYKSWSSNPVAWFG